MMDSSGNNREGRQQAKSYVNWPAIVGTIVAVIVLLAAIGVLAWKLAGSRTWAFLELVDTRGDRAESISEFRRNRQQAV